MSDNYVAYPSRVVSGSFGRMDNERHPHDLYETPTKAVDMLVDHLELSSYACLDPSAGRGVIIRRLNERGFSAWGFDLHDHGSPATSTTIITTPIDFLMWRPNPAENPTMNRHIVMNPPFKAAEEHVRHALTLVGDGYVCALLRLTWIAAARRADLLPHLNKIIICGRLKMLPPGVPDRGHSGTVDFAWFVFEPNVRGSVTSIVRA